MPTCWCRSTADQPNLCRTGSVSASPNGGAKITHVAIGMSATYAKAARDALPRAQLVVDRFHLVKRANQTVEATRRRATWDSRGRRGRKADPE